MLRLDWKNFCGNWYILNMLDLEQDEFRGLAGVYVVWHGGDKPRTLLVSCGNIKDRFTFHRSQNTFVNYNQFEIFVTWARCPDKYMNGAVAYLDKQLSPIFLQEAGFPFDNLETVNIPWD